MTDNETLERVRETFRGDRFATEMGAVIDELGDHYSKCSLVLNEHHRNAVGGIIGTDENPVVGAFRYRLVEHACRKKQQCGYQR